MGRPKSNCTLPYISPVQKLTIFLEKQFEMSELRCRSHHTLDISIYITCEVGLETVYEPLVITVTVWQGEGRGGGGEGEKEKGSEREKEGSREAGKE